MVNDWGFFCYEFMLYKQLKDQNCPASFDLLAHVVCQLNWTDIVAFYRQYYGGQEISRVLACVLLLLVQCYGDQKHVEVSHTYTKLSPSNMRHHCR